MDISDFKNAKEILEYLKRSVRPEKLEPKKGLFIYEEFRGGFFIPDGGFREPATEDFYKAAILLAEAEGDLLTAARIAERAVDEGYDDFRRIAEKLYEEAYNQAETWLKKHLSITKRLN